MQNMFTEIQQQMLTNARQRRDDCIVEVDNWKDFMINLNSSKTLFTPWCNTVECEKNVGDKSAVESKENPDEGQLVGAAKTLNIPLNQEKLVGKKCFNCDKDAELKVYWGRSY